MNYFICQLLKNLIECYFQIGCKCNIKYFRIKIYFLFRYYDIPVDKVQKLINAIDNNKTEFTYFPIITEKLRELVKIPESEEKLVDKLKQEENINNKFNQLNNELEQTKDELKQQIKNELKQTKDEIKQQIKDELKQTKDELKQVKQQIKNIQELLNSFIIKNSSSNNSN